MKTLIIYTHPNHQSLNYAMMQQVIRGVHDNTANKEVQIIDLYADGFNPALVFNEHKLRRDMHLDPELQTYREQIKWADRIVFVYPIWWGRPPAMLLGFIDRIMASGFGYAYRKSGDWLPEGLLKGKSVVCISTMKGPAGYLQLWLNNSHKILMRRALFNYIGIRQVKFFEFGSMESAKGKYAQNLDKIYRYFQKVR